jgi:hypothetical protein
MKAVKIHGLSTMPLFEAALRRSLLCIRPGEVKGKVSSIKTTRVHPEGRFSVAYAHAASAINIAVLSYCEKPR